MLPKNPGFTAVAVITLALGIGATVYGWIEPIRLHPLSTLVPTTLSLKQECQKI
jgi:hypothetical protein